MAKRPMTEKEKEFRLDLYEALRKYDKADFAELLKTFKIRLTAVKEETGGVAAIHTEHKNFVICVDTDYLHWLKNEGFDEGLNYWETITFVIKHEMLHRLMEHLDRSAAEIAYRLGFDPDPEKRTREQEQKINEILLKINHMFSGNAPYSYNIAGDADLARMYTEKEIAIAKKMGGIVREEFPEFEGYSMEQMMDTLDWESDRLKERLAIKIYGDFDENGEWVETRRENNWYATNEHQFYIDDVRQLMLPTIDMVQKFPNNAPEKVCQDAGYFRPAAFWLQDANPGDEPGDNQQAAMVNLNTKQVEYCVIWQDLPVLPVVKLKNLQWFKPTSNQILYGMDTTWQMIPGSKDLAICTDLRRFGSNIFNPKTAFNDYKGSRIEKWLKNILKNYRNNYED